MTSSEIDAYYAGKRAFEVGKECDAPHGPVDFLIIDAWVDGWFDAESEEEALDLLSD